MLRNDVAKALIYPLVLILGILTLAVGISTDAQAVDLRDYCSQKCCWNWYLLYYQSRCSATCFNEPCTCTCTCFTCECDCGSGAECPECPPPIGFG